MAHPAKNSAQPPERCQHASLAQRGAINLPILPEQSHKGEIRKSRNGKRRAVVLATVQLLIFAHILLWILSKKFGWFGGETITPIEPSESMEFTKSGVINAGLIFFSIALFSTLILGRWFCGWGCHIVMLQDLCGWIMKKCGVRPKPFRSRFLVYVPLVLAVYMFIMPAVHRWAMIPLAQWMSQKYGDDQAMLSAARNASWWMGFPIPSGELPEWKMQSHLTTTDFWKTFPGTYTAWFVVPVFLFICGFGVVYFLGAKGFCTYGCPYGGFFAPLDKLAPGRILVTNACEGCGHCTAVCTSNVRVHEEVREYGMVVNPGCMKCLDCVSVCPNEALYFGFAKPALLKGKAKTQTPKRSYDLSLGEEFGCAAVFVLSFLALRGVYGLVPMLMAVGAAGIMTYVVWKLWRLWRDQNVTLHHFQLKFKGTIKPVGWAYAAVAMLFIAWTAHSGVVNAAINSAKFHDAQVIVSQDAIFSANPPQLPDDMRRHADIALRRLQTASSVQEGGIGLFRAGQWQTEIDMMMARLMAAKLEFESAEDVLRRAIRRDGPSDRFASSLTWVINARGRAGEAQAYARETALENPAFVETTDAYVQLCARDGQSAAAESVLRTVLDRDGPNDRLGARLMWTMAHQGRAGEAVAFGRPIVLNERDFTATLDALVNIGWNISDTQMIMDVCRARLEKFPDHLHTLRLLSIALRQTGSPDESLRLTDRTLELDPRSAAGHFFRAMTLADLGRLEDAEQSLREALRLAPNSVQYHVALADVLEALGKSEEAKVHFNRAEQLQQSHQASHGGS